MGDVALCYVHETDARAAAKFIEEFGHAPPTPMERDRRAELELVAGQRPVITMCVECGDNAPETGLVCDGCREDALGDP